MQQHPQTRCCSQFAFGRQHGPKKSPHHEPKGALWQTSVVRHSYLLSSAALIPFSTYCRAAANRSRQQEAIVHRETLLSMIWFMHWLRAVGLAVPACRWPSAWPAARRSPAAWALDSRAPPRPQEYPTASAPESARHEQVQHVDEAAHEEAGGFFRAHSAGTLREDK